MARGVLIDTSALVAHLRGRVALHRALAGSDSLYVSAITVYELEYGALRAGRFSDLAALEKLLALAVLPLGRREAEEAARINAHLAAQGRGIGPRDALIAATALVGGLSLATLNVDEFMRVAGLELVELAPASG
ncbi:MAG TPA: type II toxin-antitoxin system VapC family toxin [Dehalococcoidia bacterium]|nr:type II toxin-antitoxin system VapC family toxin [Dehalococcoidia bacterium]